ncbi:hypothetical protein [Gilliamella sp. Pas-s25]|uniref:hypothetical protein n=1 Tax=Gilliamella sp. Pas-s25 TaxID=2687310 RepID=UPI00135DA855|nr:hypothetical protein [Gilliamella sp. Pas-s25]MWP61385.1 hypothetical protein [Gilliamella sp. Pas-s25]
MKITLNGKIGEHLVTFKSDLGHGAAHWQDNKPLSNTSYHIELEINDFFEWDKNIVLAEKHNCSINLIDNYIVFNAKVISCEEQGILVLSLGKDIIFIEASDSCEIGSYVSFFTTPDNVMLYPIEL